MCVCRAACVCVCVSGVSETEADMSTINNHKNVCVVVLCVFIHNRAIHRFLMAKFHFKDKNTKILKKLNW